MADDADAFACLLAISALDEQERKSRKRKREIWVQPWIERRLEHGAYHALLQELQTTDTKALRNFLRMDDVSFQILLGKVSQKIAKQETRMRSCISPEERLAVTLRYLATGMT